METLTLIICLIVIIPIALLALIVDGNLLNIVKVVKIKSFFDLFLAIQILIFAIGFVYFIFLSDNSLLKYISTLIQ